ncbi:hypothetical protein UlMin_021691 [Ulmus minor]
MNIRWPKFVRFDGQNILDPQGAFLQKWNKIFVLSCVIAVALDPIFFYIPVIDDKNKCLDLDVHLEIGACVLRTFTDIFYILRIIFQFQTGFFASSSQVFGRGELVDNRVAIAKRYLSSYFIVDLLSILPLPQVVILIVIPLIKRPVPLVTKEMLKFVIPIQYIPRFMRMYPLFKEGTGTIGAAFNIFLYMLASHLVGALWYLFSIERVDKCWRNEFGKKKLQTQYLYCSVDRVKISQMNIPKMLNDYCPYIEPDQIEKSSVSSVFKFGIFYAALNSTVVQSKHFLSKFFYCFWWGLRNLSSLGQNLNTSTFVGEIIFAVSISIFGLVLFSLLIGNMQKYLQSITVRIEEWRVKSEEIRRYEKWMSHRMIPENLRKRIRRYEQYRWQETGGVEEETLIRNLPKDLRRDIKRHLCLALLRRVPMFEKMDEQLFDAMCDRLKPVLYTQKSFIVREGDPVDEMLFIMRGNLATMITNGGRTGFFNSVELKAGDFCGEELLIWALDPHSGSASNLPISTRTVEAKTKVEAFAITSDDLKFVASQFRRLHSKQLQHTFRQGFKPCLSLKYSKTWAACFIQAAWRRQCKRKLDKSLREAEDRLQDALREAEDRLQDALANDAGNMPSLGATIYASRFAANALRGLRQNRSCSTRPPQRLLPLLPQKPAEPDFTSEPR